MRTADRVLSASSPRDVFGELDGDSPAEQLETLKARFRELAKSCHPDWEEGSTEAFQRLRELYVRALRAVEAREYGAAARVRVGEFSLRPGPAFVGSTADLYVGEDGGGHPVLVKLARRPGDSEHLRREASTLSRLLAEEEVAKHAAYLPAFRRLFRVSTGSEHRSAVAFDRPWEDLHDLRAVRQRYINGVHPKDVAWMFRRLLVALHLAHRHGWVHGAVLPEHVLIEPGKHGVVLVDWKHAVRAGERIRTVPRGRRDAYPPEVLAREPATPATDLRMAAETMLFLLGPWPASRFPNGVLRTFFRGCVMDAPRMRPQDAMVLREEFDELIGRLWGPRRFHPFTMTEE